jgi:hypothetical protein
MTDPQAAPAAPSDRTTHEELVALLATIVIALGGANSFRWLEVIIARFNSDQLPDTDFFHAMFWVWLVVSVVAIVSGFYGGYLAIVRRSVRNPYLMIFAITWCGYLIVDGVKLGLMALDLSFTFSIGRVGFGINGLGVALLFWLVALGRAEVERLPKRDVV